MKKYIYFLAAMAFAAACSTESTVIDEISKNVQSQTDSSTVAVVRDGGCTCEAYINTDVQRLQRRTCRSGNNSWYQYRKTGTSGPGPCAGGPGQASPTCVCSGWYEQTLGLWQKKCVSFYNYDETWTQYIYMPAFGDEVALGLSDDQICAQINP